MALFVAFVLVELLMPAFNHTLNADISLFNGHFAYTLGFALLITFLYGIFSGSYPAFFLSSFQPVKVLKGDVSKSKGGSLFRKSLVVVQFTASVVLIIGMIIIFQQISFIHNKNLGFKGEQVLVVPLQTDAVTENFRNYRDQFLKNPNVVSISRSSYLLGRCARIKIFSKWKACKEHLPFWNMEVDYDFLETLNIELLEGRNHSRELDNDSSLTFLMNETAVRNYNIENPIGARLSADFENIDGDMQYGTVVGIVKDFHIEGFDQPIKPMILTLDNQTWFASIRVRPENMAETISYVEETWNNMEPSHPFRYVFLDDKFGAFYKQQDSFGQMFLYLTILAIIISCMGFIWLGFLHR